MFRLCQTGNQANKTVSITERSHMLVIKHTTGRHRWYRRSKIHQRRLARTARVVCRTEALRNRTRTSCQSLAFGRSSRASVRDSLRRPTIYSSFSLGFLVIIISHKHNSRPPLHLLSPLSHLLSISFVLRSPRFFSDLFACHDSFLPFDEPSSRATLMPSAIVCASSIHCLG